MARTQQEIKSSITTPFMANATIIGWYELEAGQTFEQEFSLVSLENILFEIVAFSIWSLESLMDIFRNELLAIMALMRPHTQRWYAGKALGFMLGVPLITDTDTFDTTGLDDEAIEASKVIKQAACVKLETIAGYGILRVKVAGANSQGVLQPVPDTTMTALRAYMAKVVDAGTIVQITTSEPDKLRLHLNVYFDPVILNANGQMLDGSNDTPVQKAIDSFLQNIEFNGTLNIRQLERAIIEVSGVEEATTIIAASKYGGWTYDTEDIENVGAITTYRVADGGYMVIDDLQINWIVAP